MNKKYLVIGGLLLAGGLLYFLVYAGKEGTGVEKAEKRRYIQSVYASGYVDSIGKVQIKPEVSGYIQRIFVAEGDEVKKGDVVAIIQNDKLDEQLKEVRAKKELVENRMKENSPFLRALRDEIDIWKMNTEIEKGNFARRESLYRKGIISKEAYDQARQSVEVTEKTYTKSMEALKDQLASLNSELNSLTASEQAVAEEIEKHRIKAPVNGKVLRKFIEEGDYVNSVFKDDLLFSIGDTGRLETVLQVDEEYVPLLRPGQKVLVTTDAYPGEVFEGKLTVIESEADRVSRTVKVKAENDYPPGIPVGITVEGNIIVDDREGVFVSEEAVDDGYVEVVRDGKKVKVPVEAGANTDGVVEIKKGVGENEEIITR